MLKLAAVMFLFALTPLKKITSPQAMHTVLSQHHGKILVVYVWARYCPHCVENFDDCFARLAPFLSRGVDSISISEPDDTQGITAFLQKHHAEKDAYIVAAKNEDKVWHVIGNGAGDFMPAVYVFDKDGKLVEETGPHFEERLDTLLKP